MHGFSSVIDSPTQAVNLGVSTESTRAGDQLVFVDLDFGELEPERGSLFREVIAGDCRFFNIVPFLFTGDKGQCRCVVLGRDPKQVLVPEVEDKTTTADEDKEILHNDADDERIPPAVWLVLAFLAYLLYLATL